MPSFGNFLGRSVSEAAGFGAGLAIGPALHPVVQEVVNRTWALHPDRPLSAGEAAQIVAEAVELAPWGVTEASHTGVNSDRFHALLGEVLNAPGMGELFEARRRRIITPDDFTHGLRKAKLETRWDDAMRELLARLLDPAVIATAIQRGLIADPGILPVGPPTTTGKVPAFPVFDVAAIAEARGSGIDLDRLSVLVGLVGNPMGPEAAASAYFRGIIELADFERAIAEGNTRNEWRDAILEHARQIPSVADYVALHLRGHTDAAGMHAGAARHGMSPADADRLYLARGRPAAPGQMATAAARGIDGPLGRPMDREQFLLGIAESDIRPEWGPMLWDARFLYPPLFQLTRLVQAKQITPATAADWATKDRYAPEVVAALRQAWQSGTGTSTKGLTAAEVVTEYEGLGIDHATALTELASAGVSADEADRKLRLADDRRVKRARDAVLKKVHDLYIVHELDRTTAAGHLDELGISPAGRDHLLAVWDLELAVTVKLLTPAQIKKAAKGGELDRATALSELEARGYSAGDAAIFLDE